MQHNDIPWVPLLKQIQRSLAKTCSPMFWGTFVGQIAVMILFAALTAAWLTQVAHHDQKGVELTQQVLQSGDEATVLQSTKAMRSDVILPPNAGTAGIMMIPGDEESNVGSGLLGNPNSGELIQGKGPSEREDGAKSQVIKKLMVYQAFALLAGLVGEWVTIHELQQTGSPQPHADIHLIT